VKLLLIVVVLGGALAIPTLAAAANEPKIVSTPACTITQPDAFTNNISCSVKIAGAKDGLAWVDGVPDFRCTTAPSTTVFTGTGGSALVSVTSAKTAILTSQARYPSAASPDVPPCTGGTWTFTAFRQVSISVLIDGVLSTFPVGDVLPG
jgi:hypothetical protein